MSRSVWQLRVPLVKLNDFLCCKIKKKTAFSFFDAKVKLASTFLRVEAVEVVKQHFLQLISKKKSKNKSLEVEVFTKRTLN